MIKTRTSLELSKKADSQAGEQVLGRRVVASLRYWLHRPALRPPSLESASVPGPVFLPDWQVHAGYTDADRAIFDLFPAVTSEPQAGYVIDFLGVRTRVDLVKAFQAHDGRVYGTPLPISDGFFAETIEYVGLLKSVAAARGRFTALEFGAGWGPWLVAGAAAARHRGIEEIQLHGIEADPGHFASMLVHFRENGLNPAEHRLDNAAVGVEAGWVRWPKLTSSVADWSVRPLEGEGAAGSTGGTDYLGRDFQEHLDVRMLSFHDVLEREDTWDLVHIDVQGTECEVCSAAADLLDRRVRYLVIGTHSRKIEGNLIELFFRHGWVLENEKPAMFRFSPHAPTLESMTYNDGTQVWRNPRV